MPGWKFHSKKKVLNLVISGIPSIHAKDRADDRLRRVLNLVISGIPSIQKQPYVITTYLLF